MEPQNREPLERMTELEWMRCTRTAWRPGLRGRRTLSPLLCCVVWSSFPLGLASQEMNTWGQNKGDVCLTGAQPSWGGEARVLGTMRQEASWDMAMAKVHIVHCCKD